jgi:hypothetical protein
MKSQRKTRIFGLTRFQIAVLILFVLADVGLAFILIRLLKIEARDLLAYYAITAFILLITSNLYLMRSGSPLKRGVLIWREDLPKQMIEPLWYVYQDIENDNGFIRVDGDLRLVRGHYLGWRTGWPYVGYIDLGVPSPQIEYRLALGGVLFIIPFLITFPPFVLIMLGLNHFVERAGIRAFISEQTRF